MTTGYKRKEILQNICLRLRKRLYTHFRVSGGNQRKLDSHVLCMSYAIVEVSKKTFFYYKVWFVKEEK